MSAAARGATLGHHWLALASLALTVENPLQEKLETNAERFLFAPAPHARDVSAPFASFGLFDNLFLDARRDSGSLGSLLAS